MLLSEFALALRRRTTALDRPPTGGHLAQIPSRPPPADRRARRPRRRDRGAGARPVARAGRTARRTSPQGSTGATGATGATVAVSDDPNNYTCFGHIQKGVAEPGVTGTQVEYQFSCDGPITGYSIETEPHQIQYFDQSPVVALQRRPVVDRQLLLQRASSPGIQINCVGADVGGLRGDHRASS